MHSPPTRPGTRILSLDISTNSGYAILTKEEDLTISLEGYGIFQLAGGPIEEYAGLQYPQSYYRAAQDMASQIAFSSVAGGGVDAIVVEETNKGRNRYTQKILEFIHCLLVGQLGFGAVPLIYVSSSDWRMVSGVRLSKADKSQNAKLARGKKKGLSNKQVGIRGKINVKHVAVRRANELFSETGLDLKQKDNDVADAICLGWAYHQGVPLSLGR